MKNKIKLNDLKVNSFVTTLNENNANLLKGGTGTTESNDGVAACLVGDTVTFTDGGGELDLGGGEDC